MRLWSLASAPNWKQVLNKVCLLRSETLERVRACKMLNAIRSPVFCCLLCLFWSFRKASNSVIVIHSFIKHLNETFFLNSCTLLSCAKVFTSPHFDPSCAAVLTFLMVRSTFEQDYCLETGGGGIWSFCSPSWHYLLANAKLRLCFWESLGCLQHIRLKVKNLTLWLRHSLREPNLNFLKKLEHITNTNITNDC